MRLITLFLCFSLFSVAYAVTDDTSHSSPNGIFAIYNAGDTAQGNQHFEVRSNDGTVLLSSTSDIWKHTCSEAPSHANDVLWNSAGNFVLFSFDDGKQKGTCLYSLLKREIISVFRVEDGWTIPIRWISSKTFVIKNSTPMGGKALGGVHIYRQTYRIHPEGVERVYISKTFITDIVPYNPQ